MRRRIFIAINLPEEIKDKLVFYQRKFEELFDSCQTERFEARPCRWTKKENMHITLEFLGYLTDNELMELCQKTKETASIKKVFNVCLNKICYAPPGKKLPRMIWATGERIKEFNITPHITLARIKTWQLKEIEPEERPEINEDIDLVFEVKSIEIMESRLKRGGPEYTALESIPLSKEISNPKH